MNCNRDRKLFYFYLLPPLLLPPDVRELLPPDDVREEPPELGAPELRGAGELDTAGRLLPPDGAGLAAGALRVGLAVRTEELPELPERLSGRLYVALLVGLVYVEPLLDVPLEELPEVFSLSGSALLTW
jgi:hypothetical protein